MFTQVLADCPHLRAVVRRAHLQVDAISFYKQVKQMRWAIDVNGTQRNRGFMKHGHRQGMQELLQFAWAWRLRQDGMLLQDCPILGLFPERTGETEKDEYVHMHFKVPT